MENRTVKNLSLLTLSVFLSALFSFAQKTIENPSRPLSPNAGRVIQLKEVKRITDESGEYYFKDPWDIKVGEEGSVYIHQPDSLLKFDREGWFIRDFFKRGEGPGEMAGITDFLILEDGIILYSANVNKLIRTDSNGKLIEEFRPQPGPYGSLVSYHNGSYYFFDRVRGEYERKTGIYEDTLKLFMVKATGEFKPLSVVLPIEVRLTVTNRGTGMSDLCRMQKVNRDPQTIFLFHTSEYSIKMLDLIENKVIQFLYHHHCRNKNFPIYRCRLSNAPSRAGG